MAQVPAPRPVQQPLAGTVGSRLARAQRGIKRTPRRIFLFGDGGLGKTTLAATSSRPIFVDINQGSNGFDVARYAFDDAGRTRPQTFEELLGAVRDIAQNGKADFDTVVIDVLSDVEQLVFAEVVRKDGKAKNITDGNLGFNKGYQAAVDEWRRLVMELEACRAAGLHVILVDHFDVKKEKNPDGADYGRAMPKIDPLAAKFLHTWSDFTFFLEVDKVLVPDNPDDRKAKKQFAQSDGTRILHARPAAEYLAKSRPELADPITLPKTGGFAAILRAIIEARIPQLPTDKVEPVRAKVAEAGDDVALLEEIDARCAELAGTPASTAAAA